MFNRLVNPRISSGTQGKRNQFMATEMIGKILFTAQLVVALSVSGQNPVTELPFRMHGNYIIIPVGINQSEPLDFIFDLSAMETVVTGEVAQDLGLVIIGQTRVMTASEIRTLAEVPGQEVQIGSIRFDDLTLLVDNQYLGEFNNGEKMKGIIGYPLFSNYVIEINYELGLIRLFDPKGYVYHGSAKELEFSLMYNVPKINGQIGINDTTILYGEFLLDTGSDYPLILTTNFVKKSGLLRKLGSHYRVQEQKSPRTEYIHTKISGINFASFFLSDVPVVYSLGREGLLGFRTFDGIIGNGILKRFNLVYDHIHSTLHLEQNSGFNTPFDFNCSGMVLKYNRETGRVWVSQVLEGGPADQVQILEGDVLKAINFNPVLNLDLIEIRQLLTKEGDSVDLEIERMGRIIQRKMVLDALLW